MNNHPHPILLIDGDPNCVSRPERVIGNVTLHVMARTDAPTVSRAISAVQPGVVLFDLDVNNDAMIALAEQIRVAHPKQPLAILARWFSNGQLKDALRLQVIGCITRSEPLCVLAAALATLADGDRYYSPSVSRRLVVDNHGARFNNEYACQLDRLTQREFEVLRQIAEGFTKKQIAETLHISPKTVSTHTERLMEKLDLHDRVALTRFAIREGIAVL